MKTKGGQKRQNPKKESRARPSVEQNLADESSQAGEMRMKWAGKLVITIHFTRRK